MRHGLNNAKKVVIGMDTDLKLPSRSKEIQRFFEQRFDIAEGQLFVFDKEEYKVLYKYNRLKGNLKEKILQIFFLPIFQYY